MNIDESAMFHSNIYIIPGLQYKCIKWGHCGGILYNDINSPEESKLPLFKVDYYIKKKFWLPNIRFIIRSKTSNIYLGYSKKILSRVWNPWPKESGSILVYIYSDNIVTNIGNGIVANTSAYVIIKVRV